MKILLTGHKGFIGSHMLTALENAGHSVDTYEWGDKQLPSVMEQDWVIHIGAISATTEKDIEKVLTQNLDFSIQLYDACKMFGVNFQYKFSECIWFESRVYRRVAIRPKNTICMVEVFV